jgi:hypothetical protein
MKTITIFLTTIALVLTGNVLAQKNSRESISLGVKGGFNYSNVWDEQGQDFTANPKTGWVGGGFIAIPIGKYLGIQPEVLFSQKGFSGSGTIAGGRYSFTRTTNYLDVPILVQFKPIDYITIVAGPNYSYLMKQTDRTNFNGNVIEQEQEFETDDIRKNTLGFIGGVDVNIRSFVIGGRAGWDFQNNSGDGSSTSPRYRNQWVQLTLGLRF